MNCIRLESSTLYRRLWIEGSDVALALSLSIITVLTQVYLPDEVFFAAEKARLIAWEAAAL